MYFPACISPLIRLSSFREKPLTHSAQALDTQAKRAIDIRPGEGRALAWSFLYVFALFLAYYVLRPIRDELGVAGGVRNLPWLFTGTLVAMLLVSPLFGFLVRHWPRERFIAIAYRFFTLNLLLFAAALFFATESHMVWVGRAFFIWVSVFNLFVVSVFWSLMVDLFDAEQGKRLFGLLAAGATAGGMVGSALVSVFAHAFNPYWLLLAAAALLEAAVFAARWLLRHEQQYAHKDSPTRAESSRHNPQGKDQATAPTIGGNVFAGLAHTFRSPYLLGISAFILLYSITSTFLYFQQAEIADSYFSSRAERTAFFARIDLWVNALTLAFQLFVTARLTQWLGVVTVLCVLPALSAAGFGLLAAWPSVWLFVAVQVVRRVSNFAFAKPSREVLFTALPREDRYKAKNFIDTVIYRSGDQIGSWGYAGLGALGLGMAGISLLAVPLCLLWIALGVWLGRRQTSLVETPERFAHEP